jgi:tetratricopeptide (TPR) repeat protein
MRPYIAFKYLMVALLLLAPAGSRGQEGRHLGSPRNENPAGSYAGERPDSLSTEQLMSLAKEAHDAGRWEEAEQHYQDVLVRQSSNIEAMLELADIYKHMHKLEYARGLLLRAATLAPNNDKILRETLLITGSLSRSLHRTIDSLVAAGGYDLAVPKLSLLQTLEPENPHLYYLKALCHFESDHPEIALIEVDKAIRLRNDESFHVLREQIQEKLRREKIQALTIKAKRALKTDEEEAREKVLPMLGKILELDPSNEWARRKFTELKGGGTAPAGTTAGDKGNLLEAGTGKLKGLFASAFGLVRAASQFLYRRLDILLGILAFLLLLHSPLTQAILRGLPPRFLISGDLSIIGINEILSMLNSHSRSGILIVRSKAIKGEIYFEDGEVYHCKAGGIKGKEALKKIMKNAKQGYFHFRRTRSSMERTIETPLSLIMMDLPDRKPAGEIKPRTRRKKSKITELLDSNK